jgi:predicted transcriptional regulator
MLFKPYLAEAILQGEKTQTRRLRKTTHSTVLRSAQHIISVYSNIRTDTHRSNRLLWRVGKTYAIQPGRGKKAVGRFRLLSIRQEPLQAINWRDARAEGFARCPSPERPTSAFVSAWNNINTKPGTRWQDNPQVFVLTFELVAPKEKSQ